VLSVDHVVFALADLDRAASRFLEDFGLASVPGGHHAGWGTVNRIVPLGDAYLELIAVEDEEVASDTPFGSSLMRAVAEGGGWLTWAMRDDRIEDSAGRLGLTIRDGQRARPDGTVLRWRNAGIDEPARAPELPFFIAWEGAEESHPGCTPIGHPSRAEGVAWIELGADRDALDRWTDGAHLPVAFDEDSRGIRTVVLRTADGDLFVS
jgi:Glyoxalase-like domain